MKDFHLSVKPRIFGEIFYLKDLRSNFNILGRFSALLVNMVLTVVLYIPDLTCVKMFIKPDRIM